MTRIPQPRLRWRREARATGLASVTQGERGYELRLFPGGVHLAWVYPHYANGRFKPLTGWYWVSSVKELGIPHRNTCGYSIPNAEAAKADCEAYVRANLKP